MLWAGSALECFSSRRLAGRLENSTETGKLDREVEREAGSGHKGPGGSQGEVSVAMWGSPKPWGDAHTLTYLIRALRTPTFQCFQHVSPSSL